MSVSYKPATGQAINVGNIFVQNYGELLYESMKDLGSQVASEAGNYVIACDNLSEDSDNGGSSQFVNGQYQLYLLLTNNQRGGFSTVSVLINSSSLSVSLENTDSQSVSCKGTLAYVYQI